MRLVFMGTPSFAVPALAALIASEHEVVAVYSQPPRPAGRGMKLTPSPVHRLAEEHGIPVFTPESLKPEDVQQQFTAHEADVAVVAAYGLLLPQPILDAPRSGCINIHPSALPRWRGAAPIQRTLMAGDAATACCIMRMEEGLDTGPVLLHEDFTIPASMNAGELHDAMATLGAKLVLATLKGIATITPAPQSPAGVTYAAKITKEDRAIDWAQPAAAIANQVRGLCPAPGALAEIRGEGLKIYAVAIEPGDARKRPGEALNNNLLINCGNGSAVRVLELQRSGKNRQKASEFLQGFEIAAGNHMKSLIHRG